LGQPEGHQPLPLSYRQKRPAGRSYHEAGANGGGAVAVYSGDGDRGTWRSNPDLACLGRLPLNLTQVESIIQEKCYAQSGSQDSRAEHAARLIHSACEAINFNSIYVTNCTKAVPTNFLKEMLSINEILEKQRIIYGDNRKSLVKPCADKSQDKPFEDKSLAKPCADKSLAMPFEDKGLAKPSADKQEPSHAL
jgi:hypothetical protein